MRTYDIIKKKRDGKTLTEEEIRCFIKGYVRGDIADYQAAAFCMAVYFRGMNEAETTALTLAIRDSGERPDFSHIDGVRVDKHSTGGVGDKTTLIVAPMVASLGLKVAKMSGRGLGHTGGTIDKLEAIPGFRTQLAPEEFERVVNDVGIAIVGQSAELAPADKKLYALRDVTATVDSMPLIAASIMGKKLAADDDCIVLDVKTGSGAFMKTSEESRALARMMVEIGRRAGKRVTALITDMDRPLGCAIGNTLEVVEAIETLRGAGPEDLRTLCVTLAANMLVLADRGSMAECEALADQSLRNGMALKTFARMVAAQGGDAKLIYHPDRFAPAAYQEVVLAPRDGYITHVDTEGYGTAALLLGAGRNTVGDTIDFAAGIFLLAKTGDYVRAGEPIARLYAARKELFAAARARLLLSTVIGDEIPSVRPLVLERIE